MAKTIKPKKIRRRKTEPNSELLLSFWRAGRESLAIRPPDRLEYGKTEERLAREHRRVISAARSFGLDTVKFNCDTLMKMRRIAADFDENRMTKIENHVRRRRPLFSLSDLIRVLAIADHKRDGLIKQAINECWSVAEVERTIQVSRGGRRPHAGRHPRVPRALSQRLIAVDALCGEWTRWSNLAASRLPQDIRDKRGLCADRARSIRRLGLNQKHFVPSGADGSA